MRPEVPLERVRTALTPPFAHFAQALPQKAGFQNGALIVVGIDYVPRTGFDAFRWIARLPLCVSGEQLAVHQ